MGRSEEGENGKMKQEEIRAHPLLLDFMDAGWMGSDEGPKERNVRYTQVHFVCDVFCLTRAVVEPWNDC